MNTTWLGILWRRDVQPEDLSLAKIEARRVAKEDSFLLYEWYALRSGVFDIVGLQESGIRT